ncbi:Hypothetical protein PENO1_108980 [Penicillium occitanis (nom. inval.)]|nr:hypothetical protein PENOC_110520 [Penicillium occitanis (nom. inval.)]PCG88667.1 Hypothetical protein PENO1_108980 [Penicillium occitanis (nom. inval.)]
MAIPGDSEKVTHLLEKPGIAPLRKFGSLGYSLLLRLQSELTEIEADSGESIMARIPLHRNGATDINLSSRNSAEDVQLEELQHKLYSYYMLLDAFSKVQSSRTPHKVVLEQFKLFLDPNLQTKIEHTPWLEEIDLMNPFTNHLPQRSLITMNIVSLVNRVKRWKWLIAIITKLPDCVRPRLEDPDHPDIFCILPTDDISKRFSELVVIIVPTIIVAPMFALYAISSTWDRMACLWGFAVVFALMTRLLASESSDFIFATNAAFCAVLVVFVGNALPA